MTSGNALVTHHRPSALRAALLACSMLLALPRPSTAQEVRIYRSPEGSGRVFTTLLDDERPLIGVTTAAGSERGDTLGLRIESVTRGSPADKAGLKEGDRLQSVNGTSLRADRADAGESDYDGVLTRRLQRAVQATKPGESVTLRVLSGGTVREVRVTPVKASELADERVDGRRAMPSNDRAALGVSVVSTGNARDTLGLFVQSVVTGGPAEKAGIIEGDRIAAVNGVSLRVAREDAEDGEVGSARAERLTREIGKLKAGDAVDLTVVSGGRSRTVRVTTVKASEMPGGARGFFMMPEMGEAFRRLQIEEGMPRMRLRMPDAPRPTEPSTIRRAIPLRRTIRATI